LIALIALDEHTRDNGCLQVIAGSHRHRVGYRAEQWVNGTPFPKKLTGYWQQVMSMRGAR